MLPSVSRPSFPKGGIIAWHGLIANVPPGWALCDGTSGTPDLREKFVKGSATATEAGDTGGSVSHEHAANNNSYNASWDYSDLQGYKTNTVNHEPPYYTIQYIMKT